MKRQCKLKKSLFGRKPFGTKILLFLLLTISVLAIVNLPPKRITSVGAVNNPACYGLNISKTVVAVNQAVNIGASVSGYGIIRMAKVSAVGKRVVEGEGLATITRGTGTLKAIFSSQSPGIYVFEINAYDNNRCNFFCSAGKILYKNTNFYGGGCETAGHWQNAGSCSANNCMKWLTVGNPPTPTPTPRPVCVRRGSSASAGRCNANCQVYCSSGYHSCDRSLTGNYCVIPDMVCGWLQWNNVFNATSGACCCAD